MPPVLGHRDVSTPKPPLDATQDRRLVMRPRCIPQRGNLSTHPNVSNASKPADQCFLSFRPDGETNFALERLGKIGGSESQLLGSKTCRHRVWVTGHCHWSGACSKTKVVFVCLCANFNTEEYSHLRSDAYHLTPSCVLSNGRRKRLWKGCEGVPLPKALEPKPQMYRKPIAVQKGSLINTKSVHDVNPSANMLAISLHFSRDMTPFAKPRGTCHSPKGWSTVRSSAAINFDAGRFCVWLIAHPLVIPLPIFSGQDSKDRRPSLDLKRNMKKLGDGINHQKKKQQETTADQYLSNSMVFHKIR